MIFVVPSNFEMSKLSNNALAQLQKTTKVKIQEQRGRGSNAVCVSGGSLSLLMLVLTSVLQGIFQYPAPHRLGELMRERTCSWRRAMRLGADPRWCLPATTFSMVVGRWALDVILRDWALNSISSLQFVGPLFLMLVSDGVTLRFFCTSSTFLLLFQHMSYQTLIL